MDCRPLQYVLSACGGQKLAGEGQGMLCRVCTDSRQARPGDLFFALPGDRFDGHEYVAEAARKGASAAVVQRDRQVPNHGACILIGVADTRRALGQFAAVYRNDFSLPVVAVAGSNGKTTTKELIASVLRQKLPTLWSEASFNNDIGVPLTLLRLETSHQAAVLEAGTNHPG
ncbi:MAG TPA: Mur ligase family protein, partial [Clostridia bacterium]|nr:Mur ligase family protein [Clostridia bacterium]